MGTGLREKAFLFALFSTAALASGAGLLALDRYGLFSIGPESEDAAPAATEERFVVAALPAAKEDVTVALKGPLLGSAYAAVPAAEPAYVSEPPLVVPEPQPARRFAYIPEDAFPLSESDDLSLALDRESDNPEFWASQTHREIAALEKKMPPVVAPPSVSGQPATASDDSDNDRKTLDGRLAEISPAAIRRLKAKFTDSKVAWPPNEVSLVAIKSEKVVELYTRSLGQEWKFVHSYPVLAASGGSGPKLRRGDKQVPEGVYGISFLNPNSRYHVSLRVSYPNKFDREMAKTDGRKDLGGDIMIHGKNVSAGCLAVGDEAAEELFVLASQVGIENTRLIIAPTDFRKETPEVAKGQPKWVPKLYTEVATAMTPFKRPSSSFLSFFGN